MRPFAASLQAQAPTGRSSAAQSEFHRTLLPASPVSRALRLNLSQHDFRRIDPLFEPFIEVASPVLLKRSLVADQFGGAFDGDVNAFGEETRLGGESKCDVGNSLDVRDGTRLLVAEIIRRPPQVTSLLLLMRRFAISPFSVWVDSIAISIPAISVAMSCEQYSGYEASSDGAGNGLSFPFLFHRQWDLAPARRSPPQRLKISPRSSCQEQRHPSTIHPASLRPGSSHRRRDV